MVISLQFVQHHEHGKAVAVPQRNSLTDPHRTARFGLGHKDIIPPKAGIPPSDTRSLRVDSNGDSNSGDHRLPAATGDAHNARQSVPTWNMFGLKTDGPGSRAHTATAADTAAEPPDDRRQAQTGVEYETSAQAAVDGPGQVAHFYGSEGWGFESLRARQVRGLYPLGRGLLANGFANSAHQSSSTAPAKMAAASASCSPITWA